MTGQIAPDNAVEPWQWPEPVPDALLDLFDEAMRRLGSLTAHQAWYIGYEAGYYVGGEASAVKDHLNELCKRNRATRHDGWWRVSHIPEKAQRAKRYAD